MDLTHIDYLKCDIWELISNSNFYEICETPLRYLDVCENLGYESSAFREKLEKINNCIDYIIKFKDDFTDPNFLAYNHSFVNYSNKRKKLLKEIQKNDNHIINNLTNDLKKLEIKYNDNKNPGIVHSFQKIYNDEYFITGCLDKYIRVWSCTTGKVVSYKNIDEYITAVTYFPTGDMIAIGTHNGKCSIFDCKVTLNFKI